MGKTSPGSNQEKNREQLARELAEARRQIAELEASAAGRGQEESEREAALEALRASEARYRSVFESIGIGLTLIGLDHRVIMANAMQGEIFLKPASEFIGKYCFEEFEDRDAVCPHCPGVVAIATGQPAMAETRGVRADGSRHYGRVQAFPILDDEGVPIGFIEMVEDINEQKLAEEGRRQSEERFRLLVEHATDAFFLHDADARILDVNRRACESLGYTREELLSLSVQDFDPTFTSETADGWAQLAPDEVRAVERVQRRKDGTTFPVEVRLGVIESGEDRLYLALVRDITERKRAEEMLAHRAMQLQTSAEVAHAASSIVELDKLMHQVVDLICERFGLYYVGLFLVDQSLTLRSQPGEWAYLRAATGEAGQTMLKQKHKLRIGSNSMVGQCIARRKPCIALDVGQEAVRFANPLLPETRSELALPLISRGEAIGALTIQSTQEAAFSEEDIAVLEIMAGQIANSIENARLYKQSEAALEEMQAIHGRYVRQGWERYLGGSLSSKKEDD